MNKHIEEKLAERREYLDLIEETKEINYGLYLKMVQADEQRHGALFHEEKKISEPQILKEVKVEKTINLFIHIFPSIPSPIKMFLFIVSVIKHGARLNSSSSSIVVTPSTPP